MLRISPVAVAMRSSFVVALTALILALVPVRATHAGDATLQAEGEKAVQAWIDAVVSGDVEDRRDARAGIPDPALRRLGL